MSTDTSQGNRIVRLDNMSPDDKALWYANVMRERMTRLSESLAPFPEDTDTVVARALAVAGWALAIARRDLAYEGHVARLISGAASAVTMAQHPHPDDRVELHWGIETPPTVEDLIQETEPTTYLD